MYEYKVYLSPDEARMAHYYDMGGYLIWDDSTMTYYLNPTVSLTGFYSIMVERAFLTNKNTLWDEALRTIVKGMNEFNLQRGTPEFNAVFDKINRIRTGDSKYGQ